MFSVLRGKLTLFEGPEGYRPSEDSFWLAALLPPVKAGARVLDLGCGTGAVGLSYALHHPQVNLYGVDHNPTMLEAAHKAALENNVPFTLAEADIQTLPYPEAHFDLCFANPPFYNPTREAPAQSTAQQNVRDSAHINLWLEALLRHTKKGGYAALICLPQDAPALILQAEKAHSSCIRHYLLHTAPNKPAKRAVLVFQHSPKQHLKTEEIPTFDPQLRRLVLEQAQTLYV